MRERGPGFSLCLITRGQGREVLALARAVAVPGADAIAILLRDKRATAQELHPVAERLAELTRRCGASLRIHGHPGLAQQVGADGVHLPGDTGPGMRAQVGVQPRLGMSCHDAGQLAFAAREGADYAFLSPFAGVPGKAPPLGAAGFGQLAHDSPLPVVALGGIGPGNAASAIRAGACAVACIRSVLEAPDPAQVTRALLEAMARARAEVD